MNEKHANEIDGNVKCSCYKKLFRTERGLQQHCRITNCQGNLNTQPADPKSLSKPEDIMDVL